MLTEWLLGSSHNLVSFFPLAYSENTLSVYLQASLSHLFSRRVGMGFPLNTLKNIMAPGRCLLLLRKKSLHVHLVYLENSIIIIVNSVLNGRTWVSKQMAMSATKKELISTMNKTKLLRQASQNLRRKPRVAAKVTIGSCLWMCLLNSAFGRVQLVPRPPSSPEKF